MKKVSISYLRCKSILTGLLLVFISFQLSAQTITNYSFAASSGTFTVLSGATSPALTSGTSDDGYFNALPIGFDFWYMGTRYTTLSASTNGWITMGANITNSTAGNNLATAVPRPVIAPLWDNLDMQVATNFSYLASGAAPNRVMTLQWLNAQWQNISTGNTISFQAKLYETTGKIEFVYRPETGSISSPSASIGINATVTGSGNYLSLNGAGTSPTVSSITETTTISAKPVTGQKYAFTSSIPAAPSNLVFSNVTTSSMTLNWTDNSSNETGFVIYVSTDGVNYSFVTQTAAGVTSLTQYGLTEGTTYYGKVYAVTEGALSTALSGSQVTPVTKTFTGTGIFSNAARWTGGTLPTAGDDLIIDGACMVDNNAGIDNLPYGSLVIGNTAARTLNWIAGGTTRINVTNVSSSFAASALTMTNGGSLIINGTWTSANLIFTPGTGTIDIRSTMILPAAYATYNNLTVNASGITVRLAATTTVTGNVTISAGTFNTNNFNILAGGSWINNGAFTAGTGRVTFNGAGKDSITGNASTAFNTITINKGTSYTSNILDVQSLITMSPGGLTLTNGTFKLSSASTITPFTANITGSPYLIPSTAGLWCNGGTMSAAAMAWTINGLIRVSAGTLNAGAGIGDYVAPNSASSIIVEGGNFNLADRLSLLGATWSFTMTGGTMTVAKFGSNTLDRPTFNMDMAASSFSMSGGTIIIANKGGTAGQNLGYTNLATSGTGFTGGTLQIGDGSTPAGSIIGIISTNPIYNLTVNSANAIALITTNALIVTNDVTITAGVLSANNLNLTVGGSWTNNASTSAFTGGTATVTFNSSSAELIDGSFATTFTNLTLAGSNTVTLDVNTSVTGNLSISGGTLDLGNFTANRATAGGTLTVSNGETLKIGGTNTLPSNYSAHSIGATSTIEYSGTTQSVVALNSAQSYGHLIISGSGTKTLAGAENVAGNLTISAGTFSANNFNMAIGGNWINNGAFTAGTGTVTFNGGGGQIVSGSQALNLFNLVTNNSSGITLNTNLAVSGAHTFSAGIITTSATPNYLIYNAGSSYSGDADSKHVNGWVKKFGATNFIFPVGNGTVERTVALSSLSVSSEFNAKYFATTPFTSQMQAPAVRDVNKPEYWSINKVSGGTASVTLNWNFSKVYFPSWIVADILVTGYNGSLWIGNGGTASGTAATTGTITSSSISSFNLFTFASSSYILPLTLTSFTAKKQDNFTQLAWTTASELNMNRFVAERSDDNIHFYSIGELQARNSQNQENYFIRDNRAINGNAYYRLRCIDNDNKEKLSQVVLVRDISTNKVLTLAVNPLDGQLVLQATTGLDGLFDYRVLTMSGQLMQQGEISIQNGGQYKLSLKGNLVPGIYLLNVTDSRQNFSFKIIKK